MAGNNISMTKISIITVCYNSARTIERTIQSVISQPYPHIEYIVIDGGSIDGTVDIIKKYRRQIAKWVSEPDNGIYDAMNKGIDMATGDVIGIINSDDWYETDIIGKIARFFQSHPEVECSYGKYVEVSLDGNKIHGAAEEGPLMEYPHPTMFARRHVYQRVGGYDTNYKICADSDFMFRCQCYGLKFYYIPEIIAYFRLSGFSRTVRTNAIALEIKRSWMRLGAQGLLSKEQAQYVRRETVLRRERYLLNYLLGQRMPRYGYAGRFLKYLLALCNKRRFMLWGAGSDARLVYQWFRGYENLLAALIDNSREKQLYRFRRLAVIAPERVDYATNLILVSSGRYQEEIIEELNGRGQREGKDFFSIAALLQKSISWYLKNTR